MASLQEQIQQGQGIPACVQAACAPVPDHGPGEGQAAALLRSKQDATQALLRAYKANVAEAGFKQDILEQLKQRFDAGDVAAPGAPGLDSIPTPLLALLDQGLGDTAPALKARVRHELARRLSQAEGGDPVDPARLLDPGRPVSLPEMQAALGPGSGLSGRYDARTVSPRDNGRFAHPRASGPEAAQATAAQAGTAWMPVFPFRRADGKIDFVVFNSGRDDEAHQARVSLLVNALKREHPGQVGHVRVVHGRLDAGEANHSAVWTLEALREAEAFMREPGQGLTAQALHAHLDRVAQGWLTMSPEGRQQFIAASRAEFIGAIDDWQRSTGRSAVSPPEPAPAPGPDPDAGPDDAAHRKGRVTDEMQTDDLPTEDLSTDTTRPLRAARDLDTAAPTWSSHHVPQH